MDCKSVLWSLALALAMAAGCGRTGAKNAPVATAQGSGSPVPPMAAVIGIGGIRYSSTSSMTTIHALGEGVNVDVDLGDLYPHALIRPETAGVSPTELWVIGRTATQTVLRAYVDTTSDGVIDPGSAVQLFAGAEPEVVRRVAFDPDSGALYLMDTVTGDVHRAVDTNSDRRPDSLPQTPFVKGTWDPNEPGPVWLEVDEETGGTTQIPGGRSAFANELLEPTGASVVLMATMLEIGRFSDTNGDGVVDSLVVESLTEVIDPKIDSGPLIANLDRIEATGSEGATLQLQRVDENGALIDVLATATAEHQSATFMLSQGLVQGDRIRIHDATNSRIGEVLVVGSAALRVHRPVEPLVITDQAATLEFQGVNLDRVDDVSLRQVFEDKPTQLTLALTFTVSSDGRSISVNIPALGSEWEVYNIIFFANTAEEDEYEIIACTLCKEEAGGGSSGG